MRINQIMEADSGLAKQSANIARLERAGGSLYADDATNNVGDVARIGENKGIHFVMYPDGTIDRFERKAIVVYRTGYTGPAINDPKAAAERIRRKEEEQARKRERTAIDRADKYRTDLNAKREALRTKYSDVVIPEQWQKVVDAASEAFDHVMDTVGPDLRSGLGMYKDGPTRDNEMTKYYDPAVILDLVCDRMHDFSNGSGSEEDEQMDLTREEWEMFCNLPIKYQLKVASEWAGAMDY
jgi:hypothetical protein